MTEGASSPSALMYAFGDRLSPAPVGDGELAPLLMAVAAWALREQGTIDLAPLPHPRPVDGRLGFNRKRAYAEQPGLEGALLLSMTGKGKKAPGISLAVLLTLALPVGWETEARPDSLRHAIESGPWHTRNPHRAVIRDCRRAARKDRDEVAFSQVRSHWAHFERSEAELHAALMSDCVEGLARR